MIDRPGSTAREIAKDLDQVMDSGNAIYEVCEGCRRQYMKQDGG